jgi:hypothetical protein
MEQAVYTSAKFFLHLIFQSGLAAYAAFLRITYFTVNICTLILMFLLRRAVQSKNGLPPLPPRSPILLRPTDERSVLDPSNVD